MQSFQTLRFYGTIKAVRYVYAVALARQAEWLSRRSGLYAALCALLDADER